MRNLQHLELKIKFKTKNKPAYWNHLNNQSVNNPSMIRSKTILSNWTSLEWATIKETHSMIKIPIFGKMRPKNPIPTTEVKEIDLKFKIPLKPNNYLEETKSPSILSKKITKVKFLKKINRQSSSFRWIKALQRVNDQILSKQPVIIWTEQINKSQIPLNKLQKTISNLSQLKSFNQSVNKVLLRKLISRMQKSAKIRKLTILSKLWLSISQSTWKEINKEWTKVSNFQSKKTIKITVLISINLETFPKPKETLSIRLLLRIQKWKPSQTIYLTQQRLGTRRVQ